MSEGELSLSWDHPSGRVIDLTGTAGLFQLKLRPKATTAKRIEIRVTEGPTRLELTDGDTEVMAAVDPGWLEIGAPGEATSQMLNLRVVGLNSHGRMQLEVSAPEGVQISLEGSNSLESWTEVKSMMGQGPKTIIRYELEVGSGYECQFWRLRAR